MPRLAAILFSLASFAAQTLVHAEFVLNGKVVNENGVGVADATVVANPSAGYGPSTMTDSNGLFSLMLGNTTYEVFAFSWYNSNYDASDLHVVSGCSATNFLTVELRRPTFDAAVSGTVSHPDGSPQFAGTVGASRTVSYRGRSRYQSFSTNIAAGVFTLRLPAGTWNVAAAFGEFGVSRLVTVAAGQTVSNLAFHAPVATNCIYVEVTDDSGNPISAASVFVTTKTNGATYSAWRMLDAYGTAIVPVFDGEWLVEVQPYHTFDTSAELRPFRSVRRVIVNGNFVTNRFVFTTVEEEPRSVLVSGRVVNEQGDPLPNVSVGALYTAGTNTDANGEFSFLTTCRGNSLYAWSSDPTLSMPSFALDFSTSATNTNVVFVARAATRTLQLQVSDSLGSNVAGASVSASAWINGTNYTTGSDTDCNGLSALRVFPGRWFVKVEPHSPLPGPVLFTARKWIEVPSHDLTTNLVLHAEARTEAVALSVRDEYGVSLSNVTVRVNQFDGFADTDREVTLPSTLQLSPGAYWIFSWGMTDYILPSTTFVVSNGTTEISIPARRREHTLKVQLPADTELGELWLSAHGNNGTDSWSLSAAAGEHEIRVPGGTWEVSIYNFHGTLTSSTNIEVHSDVTVAMTLPDLADTPLFRLFGRVVDDAGNPVGGASCGPLFGTPASVVDGTYSVLVPAGDNYILCSPPLGAPFLGVDIECKIICDTNFDFILPRITAEIPLTVTNSGGATLPPYLSARRFVGITNCYVSSVGDNSVSLFLGDGEWSVTSDDWSLNPLGYRSFTTNIVLPGTTSLAVAAEAIIGDGRVPQLSAPIGTASTRKITIRSQTGSFYALERSEDLTNWTRVAVGYTVGGRATLVDSNAPAVSAFYRAVMTIPPW